MKDALIFYIEKLKSMNLVKLFVTIKNQAYRYDRYTQFSGVGVVIFVWSCRSGVFRRDVYQDKHAHTHKNYINY